MSKIIVTTINLKSVSKTWSERSPEMSEKLFLEFKCELEAQSLWITTQKLDIMWRLIEPNNNEENYALEKKSKNSRRISQIMDLKMSWTRAHGFLSIPYLFQIFLLTLVCCFRLVCPKSKLTSLSLAPLSNSQSTIVRCRQQQFGASENLEFSILLSFDSPRSE